ncbi:MAG TPA: ATP-binding protein [Myxococcales bacterium]|nr:ATP-binding protein [Myxococcales bacterium]
MSLRAKLLLALAPLALVLIALGTFSVRAMRRLGEDSQLILRDNYRSVVAVQRMKEALERLESAASLLVLDLRAQGLAQAALSERKFDDELGIQEGNITEPGEAEATRALREVWGACKVEVHRFEELPPGSDLRAIYFASLLPSFSRVKDAADRVLYINQDAMVLKSERARRTSQQSTALLIAATAAAFLVGLLASGALTARLLRPLRVLAQAVRRIGEGDLAARANVAATDEIGQLAREFNTMVAKLGEYRRSSLGELLQAQQSAQAAIDSLPDPVIVVGQGGDVLNVNSAAEALLRPMPGVDPFAGAAPELRAVLEKVRAHVLSGNGPYLPKGYEEAIALAGEGGVRHLLPRATPVYSEQGGVQGATLVLQDVTRLMRFDELKNDLVATVAHEFRTPLTSLRMAIHLCLEEAAGPVTEKQAELLHAAREDCERLQSIVDDLLDLSRIQSGRVEVSPIPLPAKTLVDAALAEQRAAADAAGVELAGTIVEPVLPVLADPERISLVLGNLLSNAIRYSPRRQTVELRSEPQGGRVRFSVTDRGPGIPREQQQRVFEKFVRLPGAKGEGIGLGLYISREIVVAHGGEMGFEDAPGGGSRFWFTLPVIS